MVFNSLQYGAFLLVVLAGNWALPRRARPAWLLLASYAFYASWGWSLLGLLLLSTTVTWLVGRSLPGASDPRRRVLLGLSLLTSLGVVSIFKVIEVLRDSASLGSAEWVIPVGLSFFTFQAISYVVDIYRGDLEPSESLVDVALYLAFFPHLLAGPVVRASKLIPQFHQSRRRPDARQWAAGAELILFGLFKKVALADPMATQLTELVSDPGRPGPVNGLVLTAGGILAGYFDITGYIDIARGSAKLLGIEMQRNSLSPLLRSTGYADFWRRWQLTLMMWFRDYVYLPLRGDGSRPWREPVALFGSFAALGVWHGLSLGWVLWGFSCGVIIVIERQIQARGAAKRRAALLAARRAGRRPQKPRSSPRWARLALTYVLVIGTIPLVTAERFSDLTVSYRLLYGPGTAGFDWDVLGLTVLGLAALFALDGRERRREQRTGSADPLTIRRTAAYALAVVGIVVFSGAQTQPFIYFAF